MTRWLVGILLGAAAVCVGLWMVFRPLLHKPGTAEPARLVVTDDGAAYVQWWDTTGAEGTAYKSVRADTAFGDQPGDTIWYNERALRIVFKDTVPEDQP